MSQLWLAMSGIFGSGFLAAYGPTPNQIWVDLLRGMSKRDFGRGLDALRRWEGNFAPTLAQFRALCGQSADATHEGYTPPPARSAESLAIVETELAKMRALTESEESRPSGLSESDRALMDQLDWAYLRAVAAGEFDGPRPARIDAPMGEAGCTCRTSAVVVGPSTRYVVSRHDCPVCVEWMRRIREMSAHPLPIAEAAEKRVAHG